MSQRINYFQQSPDLVKTMIDLGKALEASSIEQGIRHLVEIRASQINGCAFCLDMHIKQARMHGERELRLHHLVNWRESPLFSARESAALAWTEILTRIPEEGVSMEAYERARSRFSEKELSDLTFVVMSINAWNRANIAFTLVPGSFDKTFGLDKSGLT